MTALTIAPAQAEQPLQPGAEPARARSAVLRVLPAPISLPPYDDEPGPRPTLTLVPRPLRPEPTAPHDTGADAVQAWLTPHGTPTSSLPPARTFAAAVVRAVLESLTGVRSVKQLQRDTTPELYAELAPAISRARTTVGSRPDARAIRSLHLQTRPEGVVEACATVVRNGRLTALALRLEGFEGRWRVTDVVGV